MERKFWVVGGGNSLTPKVQQVVAESIEDDHWYVHPNQVAGIYGQIHQQHLFASKKEALDQAIANWTRDRNNIDARIKHLREQYNA